MRYLIISLAMIAYAQTSLADLNLKCLASVIYHEARGEKLNGQIAVGHVVLNRVKLKNYPNSICKVAFQPHQFTDLKRIKYDEKSLHVAKKVMSNTFKPPLWFATHYHSTSVNPRWANWSKLERIGKVGNHIFYRLKKMPLYAFKCTNKDCGNKLEVLQKVTDSSPVCPLCGKQTEKLVSASVGFDLKGTGWYKTDFKNKS